MSLIDLKKLNAEIDELIARQDEEVKAMKVEAKEKWSQKYSQMIASLKEFAGIAKDIDGGHGNIEVLTTAIGKPGNLCCTDYYYIRFSSNPDMYHIVTHNILGADYINYTINFNSSYETLIAYGDYEKMLNGIVGWWTNNMDEFERRFEEACLKYIKEKAEKANDRYKAAERRLNEAQ